MRVSDGRLAALAFGCATAGAFTEFWYGQAQTALLWAAIAIFIGTLLDRQLKP